MPEWLIALAVIAAALCLLLLALHRGWLTMGRRGSFTGMTVFHDWSNQETQKATRVIIERNAGKKEKEQQSGEPDFEELLRTQETDDNLWKNRIVG
jgi:hypothetical protein